MSKKCCFICRRLQLLEFTENSRICKNLKKSIKKEIASLIENENVTHFISGMELGFETYMAEIVLELKEKYDIILECALPCETQANNWCEKDRDKYFSIIEKCDKFTLLQTHYTRDCVIKKNRYMINNSDFVITVSNDEKCEIISAASDAIGVL